MRLICWATAFWLAALAGVANAEPINLSGSGTIISDYRFRGVSYSNGDPEVHVTAEATHSSGFYAGVWVGSVSGARRAGASAEADVYIGYHTTKGLLTYDAGVEYFSYPGAATGSGLSIVEPYATISGTLGATTARLGIAYAPRQGSAVRDRLYSYAELIQPIPRTPITLRAHVGHTRSGLGAQYNALDYGLGADVVRGKITFSLSYTGTDISRARAGAGYGSVRGGLVGGVSVNF